VAALAPARPRRTSRLARWARSHSTPYLLSLVGGGWMILFFLVPLGSGLIVSLETGNPVNGFTLTWNWRIYSEIFYHSDIPYGSFLGRSLLYALASTVIAIVIAYPMAYYIAFRVSQRWKSSLLLIVLLSFFVSFVIRTDMWSFILSNDGIVLTTLRNLHIVNQYFHILGTPGAVVGGDVYNNLAFMVLPIYAALERVDQRVLEAARDLYGKPRDVFARVVLPLSRAGIFAGVLLVFITVAGDPVNSALLGGVNTYTIGQAIQDAYLSNQQYNIAAALSTVLMVILGVILFAYARIFGTENIENLV
jgi:spermidine/putrescine transport system permease protein